MRRKRFGADYARFGEALQLSVAETGACDYNRAGVEQVPVNGTWMKF
jgi:hypothetical protein